MHTFLELDSLQDVFLRRFGIVHREIDGRDGVHIATHTFFIPDFGINFEPLLHILNCLRQISHPLSRATQDAVGVALEVVFHAIEQRYSIQCHFFRFCILVGIIEIVAHPHKNGGIVVVFILLFVEKRGFHIFLLNEQFLQLTINFLLLRVLRFGIL